MKTWNLQLEIRENEDEFFQTLEYSNQHHILKQFILDVLHANGFEAGIKLNKYEESYDDEEFEVWKGKEKKPAENK